MSVKSKPAACGSVEDFDLPLSRFPLRGQAGAGGFPPRRKHATRQQKALARIAAAGSPHKRGCRPLVYPPRAHWWNQGGSINPDSSFRQNMNFSVDTTSLLMEAATVRESVPKSLFHQPARATMEKFPELNFPAAGRTEPASRWMKFYWNWCRCLCVARKWAPGTGVSLPN